MISIDETIDDGRHKAGPEPIDEALRPRPIRVSVIPVDGGWSVVHDLDPLPLMFLTGGRAEAQALRIVRLANVMGSLAQLEIYTRDGRPAPPRRRVQASPSPTNAAITRLGSTGFSKRRT